MSKKICVYLSVIILAMFICWPVTARAQQDGQALPTTPKYNSEDEAITGTASEEPDQGVKEGTIEEYIVPDKALTQGALPDAPVADPTLVEAGEQQSVLNDDTMRSTGDREGAGDDTTGRSTPADDNGAQQYANPYGATPDLFEPKKK